MRRIIIDTDPGIDDATAITLALNNSNLDVLLISTVAGNVGIENTTNNALKLVEFFDKTTPVARGAEKPLIKELEDASNVHGETGMGGYDFPELKTSPLPINAIEAMYEAIITSKEKVTLVPIGALTNIALLIKTYPDVMENIEEIVMMGGSLSGGNTNSVAEFNIYVDPHAADIVFKSGLKIVMVGLDVTNKAVLHQESSLAIQKTGKAGDMVYNLFKHYRSGSLEEGLRIHDACAIAYLLKPELFRTEKKYVQVVTEGLAAGALVADGSLPKYANMEPNIDVCVDVDASGFENWMIEEFKNIG